VSDETPPAPGGFTTGSRIAGYRLEEQIGRGGMAVVFRAHDPRLDRRVALKILAPELARDDAFRQRFIRESRAAAAVDDPHIIPVFEAGEAAGVLFIAMRYVQGRDVRSLLDELGTLPPPRAISIITQVASALDAAHSHGLVHRDVKPANMLLDRTVGRADHVYLSDFGLSKQSLSSSGLTGTGQFLGTLDYVAPEQIEGRPVDGRTDLYALAGAAFEMLGGAPPFKRDQGLAVLWAQISEPPPPLTARRAELPPAVDQVMAKALAKAPDDRYATCLDFAAALRQACDLRPDDSSDPGALPRSSIPPRQPTEVAMPSSVPPRQPTEVAGPSVPPRQPTEVAGPSVPPRRPAEVAASSSQDQPVVPPRQPTEVATPSSVPPLAAGQGRPSAPPGPGGPPTEAASIPGARGSTKPGLTEPPSAAGPYGQPPDYGQPGYGPPSGPARPWWRSRGAMAAAAAVIVLAVIGGGYALIGGGGNGSKATGGGGVKHHGGGTVTAVAPKLPGCTTVAASAKQLSKVTSAMVKLGGHPFGVTTTPSGAHTFVTLGNSVAVLANGSALAPTLLHTMSVPGAQKGDVVTSDDQELLVASGSGALVLKTKEAEHGHVVLLGTLSSPGGRGAVEVELSPNGRFVFVTLQSSGGVAVFNLQEALAGNFASAFVGLIPTGVDPVGMATSPDGKWLYVTSIEKVRTSSPSAGILSVVNLAKAEVNPAKSVVSTAAAGCSPVRVIVSANGADVWVTARESDALLGFSAAKLRTDPKHALIARVDVGAGPIGLTFVDQGKRIVVANSNLKNLPGAVSSLSVVSTSAALAGKPALLGTVKSGVLPRQFAIEGGSLLVTNTNSGQLQAVNLADLP
jgi:serine/threonine protein kinase